MPLLEVRNVKPSLLLRQDAAKLPAVDWLKWMVTGAVAEDDVAKPVVLQVFA